MSRDDSVGSSISMEDATEDIISIKPRNKATDNHTSGEDTLGQPKNSAGTIKETVIDPKTEPAVQEPTVALLSLSKSKRARQGLRLGGSKLMGGAMRVQRPAKEPTSDTSAAAGDAAAAPPATAGDGPAQVESTADVRRTSVGSAGTSTGSITAISTDGTGFVPPESQPAKSMESLSRSRSGTPPPLAAPEAQQKPADPPKMVAPSSQAVSQEKEAAPVKNALATLMVNGTPYQVLQIVGKGGSSKVFKVMGPGNKIYALKRVEFEEMDKVATASFMEEIALLKRLSVHTKTIVRFIDSEIDHEADTIHVVMECGEIDLWHMLRQLRESGDALNENYIRLYWQQMLEAVQTIHDEKIIHSDLKPANFLCVSGMLKLIDFGIARAIQNDATSIMCEKQMGTLNYMSPEAINSNAGNGGSKIGRASDVWSLGCILYEMAYGGPPFASIKNLVQKIQSITNPSFPIQFPETPNADLLETIQLCLQREAKDRPTIPELLAHPFLDPTARLASVKQEMPAAPAPVNPSAVSANQIQALLPVLQQLTEANVQIDATTSQRISEEIARQLQENGTVDITGIVNDVKSTHNPAPKRALAPSSAGKSKQAQVSDDKENMPPNVRKKPESVAAPVALGGISQAQLQNGASRLKKMQKIRTVEKHTPGAGGLIHQKIMERGRRLDDEADGDDTW